MATIYWVGKSHQVRRHRPIILKSVPPDPASESRKALRRRLLEQREKFVTGPLFSAAGAALAHHLATLLAQLEPELLGLYWPYRSEFNAGLALAADPAFAKLPIALPFAQRLPARLHYRAWDGQAAPALDDCGIPCSTGAAVVPDVVLVPCVGFTATGYRLGYGGGYFDRWLAQHPEVTSVGVAWAISAVDADAFNAQAHDQALALIVTERGVV